MARLRPVVIPVAALTLATATPGAHAQQRRQATEPWAASPRPATLATEHADLGPFVSPIQQAMVPLPLAELDLPDKVAIPDGRFAIAALPAAALASGRPTPPTARGPPS